MNLPPLPAAAIDEHNLQGGRLLYTYAQMRDYATAAAEAARAEEREACAEISADTLTACVISAVLAEREACAKVCDDLGLFMTALDLRARGE
jgi:hypothetical protein